MSLGQTKRHSFIESIMNVLIGYGIAVLANALVFPFFDIHVTIEQNMKMAGVFTVISIVRSYCLRRVFNKIMLRGQNVRQ